MTSNVRLIFERLIPSAHEARIREWAADNAYSLIAVLIFFSITWALILIDIFVGVTR